ncbi:MAG: hypothetical protein ACI915_003699, partial [Gammaproteobacteria bacterium]
DEHLLVAQKATTVDVIHFSPGDLDEQDKPTNLRMVRHTICHYLHHRNLADRRNDATVVAESIGTRNRDNLSRQ